MERISLENNTNFLFLFFFCDTKFKIVTTANKIRTQKHHKSIKIY